MGRGISPLQRTILVIADRNKRNGTGAESESKGGDVLYWEVLVEHFGWTPKHRDRYGVLKFSPAEIGEARYNAALASVSRAMWRLGQRGLLTCKQGRAWSGGDLTPLGQELASTLSVNRAESFACS